MYKYFIQDQSNYPYPSPQWITLGIPHDGIDCSQDEKNTMIIPILDEEGCGGLFAHTSTNNMI